MKSIDNEKVVWYNVREVRYRVPHNRNEEGESK